MNLEGKIGDMLEELRDIRYEITRKLGTLIEARWDSNTLKLEIEELMRQHRQVNDELYKFEIGSEPDKLSDRVNR